MKLKKLIFLVIILALLFSAVAIKKTGLLKPKAEAGAEAYDASLMTGALTQGEIKKLSIIHPGGVSIVASKKEDGLWKLDNQYGVPARKRSVEDLLDQIWKVRGEISAENTEVLTDFGLSDTTAVVIRLEGDSSDKFQEVYLSTQRPGGTKNFVRLANVSRVLSTNTDLLTTLNIFSKDDKLNHKVFADLRPAGIEASKVETIEFTQPGAKTLIFEKKKDSADVVTWSLKEDSSEVDTAKINEFLSALYNLYGNDALDPAVAAKDITGQNPWIRLQWKNGDTLEAFSLWLGTQAADKKNRVVKADPSGIYYELTESQIEPLLKKDRSTFLKQKGA